MHPLAIADETTDDGEPSGRGLIAVKGITQGEPVFEVPISVIMTAARALELVPELPADTDEYIAIATLLIQERAKSAESFWKPYLDILPEDEDMIPLFRWTEEDMALLKGSPCITAAASLLAKLSAEFMSTEEAIFSRDRDRFPEDVFTLRAWEWAFAVLFSRAIMLPREGYIALVPYADLLNHNSFCSTFIDMQTEVLTREKNVVLYTDRPYSKMDQVWGFYGPKSNAELLLLYGFVADRNPYDAVEIYVAPDPSDPLFERKRDYLLASGLKLSSTFPLYGDRYPMELIEYLRFCVSTEEELDTADFGGFISEENETLVARALTEACQAAIESYPQTVEEDKALMSDRGMWNMLSNKKRCAIRQRLAEKQILRRTISNIMKEAAQPAFMFAGPSSANA
jgi:hypothetical protein